jgi:hypothetical protein
VPGALVGETPREQLDQWGHDAVNYGVDLHRVHSDGKLIQCCGVNGIARSPTEERAFAEMWDYTNNGWCGSSVVYLLLNGLARNEHERKIVEQAAASVIQWLGTNVGSSFVNQSRDYAKKLAYDLWPDAIQHLRMKCALGMITRQELEISAAMFEKAKLEGRNAFVW